MLATLLNASNEVLKYGTDAAEVTEQKDSMFDSTVIVALLAIAGLFALSTWLFFLWAIKDKQFEDVEEIGHRLAEIDNQV